MMRHHDEKANLRDLIKAVMQRNLRLAVLGCGYVGLPTAVLFSDVGFTVTAIDVKAHVVENLNDGISPITEPGLQELVSRNFQRGRLKAVLSSETVLSNQDAVIISVQTPIDKTNKPDLSFLMNAIETVGKSLKKGALVAVCSTVPPRTTREKVKPLLESLSGLNAEDDFYLAYVPERITPGKALKEFVETPRLVGGIGEDSTAAAAELFRTVCERIIETDATTAEIAKTAENTFRDVNIAFANQLALICEQHGADVTEVIELANTHPRVNIHAPGPGVGGPCLTKDPYLLIHESKLRTQDIIKTARSINDYMPYHVVELTLKALMETGKSVKNSRIAILGTAYKADVDDPRFSPSESIIEELMSLGAEAISFDPHCTATFGAKKAESLSQALKDTDCLLVLTDHTEFKHLDLNEIKALMNHKPAIIDGKRIINPNEAQKLDFTYYGIGYRKPNQT
jgi:UDP-N-acetyl-D-mannosaminuronic acid dehydrogenase